MKFSDGYWQVRDGIQLLRPRQVVDVTATDTTLTAFAPARPITSRGDTLNCPQFTITLSSPIANVITVEVTHFAGAVDQGPHFQLAHEDVEVTIELPGEVPGPVPALDGPARLTSGQLVATIDPSDGWRLDFTYDGRALTTSGPRSIAHATVDERHRSEAGWGDFAVPASRTYMVQQLGLGVGETIHGLGERFGAFVKNGQSIDIWNADGGTSSEQAYKNIPFYLSSRGYGVLVDEPGLVSFEVGSEDVSSVQFSVSGERMRYHLIGGANPAQVLERYTALTGRPPRLPEWSYGLWLSTSFTTSYDEATVMGFLDGMRDRGIDVSVFHFDCFWMRGFHWTDLVWDPATFPDPRAMLGRIHERGIKTCAWINPYIAQRSELFTEGLAKGYFVKRPDGSVWQTDLWQAGMALVDFTNPEATAWFQQKLSRLLDEGVDAFKTDFGERIPTDVVWHDGSDPERMHNHYTQQYNRAVFELLQQRRGEGEAVLFARSATVGGQQFPVHWGGDCESTFEAMAQSLRGGLSLASSGFGYWSHDIGGFEGTPDPAIYKRWVAFGLLSSHSRLHGSNSYRVPWAFDDEAVEVTRQFVELKKSLRDYLLRAAEQAVTAGLPVMRPMFIAFPEDPACQFLDRQYMLGDDLLVAPVMSFDGQVSFYLPAGRWTHLLDGEVVDGGRYITRTYGFDSLPLFLREGAPDPRV